MALAMVSLPLLVQSYLLQHLGWEELMDFDEARVRREIQGEFSYHTLSAPTKKITTLFHTVS